MSTLFAELERSTAGMNCTSTYPAPSPTSCNSVASSAAAVAAAVAAASQLPSAAAAAAAAALHQQQQQQQQQQSIVPQVTQQQLLSSTTVTSSTPQSSPPHHQSVVTNGTLGSSPPVGNGNGVSNGGGGGGNSTGNLVEDQRALQLAFELSLLGLADSSVIPTNGANGIVGNGVGGANTQFTDLTNCGVSAATAAAVLPPGTALNSFASILPGIEDRSKKSQNMTECVPVPSSEHVAEIVGRQGCKIKALRAKTNTYIKTPVRGEEPVFVVTGRKEDVGKAKREILSAAEHFSLIRASRKPALSGMNGTKGTPPGPPTNIPGQITIQVRVPYRVVGLVVGPKGATIKHIQQQTHTYIVTPSRDKEPIFEVTGMPDNVHAARRQIEAHIALRTGNIGLSSSSASSSPPSTNGTTNGINGIGSLLSEEANSEFLASLYKNGFGSLLGYLDPNNVSNGTPDVTPPYVPSAVTSSTGSRSCSSSSSSTSSKSATTSRPELINIWKNLGDSIDVDEGLGESPNIWALPPVSSTIGSRCSPSTSVSPTDSLLNGGSAGSAISANVLNINGNTVTPTAALVAANAVNATICGNGGRRECLVCGDKEVTAALVPCGHNMFCMDCATRISGSADSICPVCSQTVLQAIRIIA